MAGDIKRRIGVVLDAENDSYRKGFREASDDTKALGDTVATETAGMSEDLKQVGDSASRAGDEAKRSFDGIAAGGALLGAGLTATFEGGIVSAGQLQARLGLTADEAREFDKVAKEVYRDNFGDSMSEAAAVVGRLNQSLGIQGGELKGAAEGVFAISDAFEDVGADAGILIEDLRVMQAVWPGVTQERALDLIAHALQNGTGNAGDLLDTVQEYSGAFAAAGFSADDLFVLLDSGMRNGARNTDIVADAILEMGIRIQTAGDTGQDAVRRMFPRDEAERIISDFAAGGDAARDAFRDIGRGLAAVQDPQDQYNLSVELFGTRGEEIQALIPTLTGTFDQLGTSTEEAAGSVELLNAQYTGGANLVESFKRRIETSVLAPLGNIGPTAGIAIEAFGALGTSLLGLKAIGVTTAGVTAVMSGGLDFLAISAYNAAGALGTVAATAGAIGAAVVAVGFAIKSFGDQMDSAGSDADEMARRVIGNFDASKASAEEFEAEFARLGEARNEFARHEANAVNPFLAERHKQTKEALDEQIASMKVTGQVTEELMRTQGLSADEALNMAASTDELASAADTATAALEAQQRATDDLHNSILAGIDAEIGLERANIRAREAVVRYAETNADAEASADDLTSAELDATEAVLALADAAIAAEENALGLEQGQLGSAEAAAIQREKLQQVANILGPADPLRQRIEAYLGDLARIPSDISTTIRVHAPGVTETLDGVLRIRGLGAQFRADGGPVRAGESYIVGEEGPELITPGVDGFVHSNPDTMAMMSGRGAVPMGLGGSEGIDYDRLARAVRGSGATANVTVNYPKPEPASDGLVRAARKTALAMGG